MLCVVAAVLVWQDHFFLGGIAFVVGSVCDTLDGRYSRDVGQGHAVRRVPGLDARPDRGGRRAHRRRRRTSPRPATTLAVAAVVVAVARLADGLLHARPRRGARRRVQGRHRRPRGARRHPVGGPAARQGFGLDVLELAVYVLAGLSVDHGRSSASSTCAAQLVRGADRRVTAARCRGADVPPQHPYRRYTNLNQQQRHNAPSANGGSRATRTTRSASPSSASATAPSSFVQGVQHYRDADAGRGRPRPHARRPRRLPRPRHRVHGRVRHRRRQGRQGPLRGDLRRARTTRSSSPTTSPNLGVPVQRGMTHDGLGKYLKEKITKAPGETADIVADPQGDQDRRRRLLPAGRLRAGDEVVRRADPRGRLRLRELHPGVHRPRGLLEQPLQEGRPADRRRRHQVPGRRDDRAPHARPPVPRARREDAAHVAAQRRRQHGLLQHARARAPGVQEDLQDERRHVDHGPRAARRRRLHRPVGLRAVADRPQVGAHPHRGPGLRRRAAQHRAEARGLGLAELGRHRHRRRALLQARAQPRRRRPARRPAAPTS